MDNNSNNLGNLAYYDSLVSGLVPCKVTGYDGFQSVYFTVTATRGAYKLGEKLQSLPSLVVPRKCVHVRNGQYRIHTWYTWVNGVNSVYAIRTRGAK